LTYAALAERLKCCLEAIRSLVAGEVTTLKVRIELLQAELVKLETTAAGHRADYERERDRADRLVTELLKVTANTTREMAAKLEGEIAALRLAAEAEADGPIVPALADAGRRGSSKLTNKKTGRQEHRPGSGVSGGLL
jgi:predicted  nucleic acid-binding Zn-ribbon protein